ncbi:ABC transporter permease [Mumia quercus]|uniref:ABC transporter permease n=1 Tax=Mumia quercus TaxID=2976125 RepID=UPI0021D19F2B|nr:ABC transporter permease [Mumia quercus]
MSPANSALSAAGTAAPPGRPRHRGLAVPSGVLGVLGIVGFLATWELVVRSGLVEPRYLPAASSVLGELASLAATGSFWEWVGLTLRTWAVGLAVAGVAAIVLGLVIGSSRFLRQATHSTIEFLRPIPSVALIPLAVLLYGTSMQATLLLVVYAAFWQVLIQVLYGAGDVDPVADDTARSYGLGWTARVRYLVWPSALPYVMTGLRLGAAVALILTVTGELVIGGGGLGTQIALAQGVAVTEMYALVVATGLIGVAINLLARAVEKRALRWHVSVRREAVA